MWKLLRSGERVLTSLSCSKKCRNRTFLSEAYRCTDSWNKRLDSSLLAKVNSGELFIELDQKFDSVGKVHAVDIDIYANVLQDAEHTDELVDVLHRFRLSPETSNTLDSTHHAVIRFLLENDKIEDLMTILNDRINYGIFPDHFCYNILMDTFIKKQDFGLAARTAVLLMLQEDSEHPISNALALYACHKYLEKPDSWTVPEPVPEPDTDKEIKVRVRYIRNPFFDDHFDLQQPSDLVGKTLVFYGKSMDDVLGRTCHLRGLILWKKYVEAKELIEEWIKAGQKECIYGEVVPLIEECLANISEENVTDDIRELRARLEALDKSSLKEGSIVEDIENKIRIAVEKQAEVDISQQCQIYQDWETTRISILEQQLDQLDKEARLERVEKMKKELAERERLVTFFENRHQIELAIQKKNNLETAKYGKRRRKSTADIDQNYVPPEVNRKHNV